MRARGTSVVFSNTEFCTLQYGSARQNNTTGAIDKDIYGNNQLISCLRVGPNSQEDVSYLLHSQSHGY